MNIDDLRKVKPAFEIAFSLLDEIDKKDAEIAEIRNMARTISDDFQKALNQINDLKKENHAMQLFIEEHVPEDKKKLIFKDVSEVK